MCNSPVNPSELAHIAFKKGISKAGGTVNNLEHLTAIQIIGSFGTKIDAILKHIISIMKESPDVKILCFSQWKAVLDIFNDALEQNKIGYMSLEGQGWSPSTGKRIYRKKKGESVREFFQNPNLTVFLLNAKSQSSGLTLNVATHVFLIDPVVQKGLEMQGISVFN
jgi:E3 ubiquitin-protein ligase SHPRH